MPRVVQIAFGPIAFGRLLACALGLLAFGCSSGGDGPADGGGGTGGGGLGGQPGACVFATTYTIVDGGGLALMLDTATLTPPDAFRYERQSFVSDAGQPSCAPPLPACHDPARIDVSEVEGVLASNDVQDAFARATIPSYGDRGIADGPSFTVTRADGHGFNVGLDCDTPSPTCTPTPPGIKAARTLLRALISQQLADPSCAAFSP